LVRQATVTTVVARGVQVAVNCEFDGELVDGNTVHLRFADLFRMSGDSGFTSRDTLFFAPLV
jgi:hypothetical protein